MNMTLLLLASVILRCLVCPPSLLPAQYDMPSTLKSCELMMLGDIIQHDVVNRTYSALNWQYPFKLKWLLHCQQYNMKELGR